MRKQGLTISAAMLLIVLNVGSYAENNTVNEPPQVTAKPVLTRMAPDRQSSKDNFKLFDSDGDNRITFDEYYQGQELQKKKRAEKELNQMLLRCDKNKDGAISEDELLDEEEMMKNLDKFEYEERQEPPQTCMFPKEGMEFFDENSDGTITREELLLSMVDNRRPSKKTESKHEKKRLKREAKRRVKQFTACDTDADQALSMRESFSMKCSLGLFTEQFDAYDTNLDGFLDIEEIATEVASVHFRPSQSVEEVKARKKMPPLIRLETSMFECDADEDGRLGKNETISANCEQDMVYFDSVDNDKDGYISLDEISRVRMKKGFDRMDKNKDGFLDSAEFKSRFSRAIY